MDRPASHAAQVLRDSLHTQKKDFELLSPVPADCVQLRFVGPFQGQDVVWDAQFFTLARYAQQYGLPPDSARRGLMHIMPERDGMTPLQVAMRAGSIDVPTVQKVIIMMRNYKQLSLGMRVWSDDADTEMR